MCRAAPLQDAQLAGRVFSEEEQKTIDACGVMATAIAKELGLNVGKLHTSRPFIILLNAGDDDGPSLPEPGSSLYGASLYCPVSQSMVLQAFSPPNPPRLMIGISL